MPKLTWWEQLLIQVATEFLNSLVPKVTDPVKKARLETTVGLLKEHQEEFRISSAS